MTLTFLARWFRRQVRQRPDLHVLLYTRVGCGLCEEAKELLERHQQLYGFRFDTKDIDESEELVQQFGNCVPVVAINGRVRFRGKVNEVLLRRMLEASEARP